MTQFVAILKDSFREAVDGFVIYLMLGLSALLVAFVGSISYAPAAAADALPRLLDGRGRDGQRFHVIFPARGQSPDPARVPARIDYAPADIREEGGAVSFVLRVRPHRDGPVQTKDGKEKTEDDQADDPAGPDGFRWAAYTWTRPPGEKPKNEMLEKLRKAAPDKLLVERVPPPEYDAAAVKALADDDLAAFVKYQFAAFVGVDAVVTRRPGVAEPRYEFDVRLPRVAGAAGWPHDVAVLFGAFPPIKGVGLGTSLLFIQDKLVNGLGAAVALIIAVVITAFFVPNLLRKGSIDLLVSKPIGRVQLLVYKYVGGLTFILITSAVAVGGVWLVTAARSGNWNPGFLLVIPVLTFSFAILYAVSVAVAVFTRSAIAAILVTLAFMLGLFVVGIVKAVWDANRVVRQFDFPEWSYTLVDGLNAVLPRYKDLDNLTGRLVAESTLPVGQARLEGVLTAFPLWGGAVGVSLAFIALVLALSSWRFVKRDY